MAAIERARGFAAGLPKRPWKLTAELERALCELLAAGVSVQSACAEVGVSMGTFRRWLNRGRDEIERIEREELASPSNKEIPYVMFYVGVQRAQAALEKELVTNIVKAGKKDWRANGWMLERRLPHLYGERSRLEVTGDGGGPVEIQVSARQVIEHRLTQIAERLKSPSVIDITPKVEELPSAEEA